MTILVTGGAGFIGSNFIRDWLALHAEPLVNLDKLTYAGNLFSLKEFLDDSRLINVHGDIGDAALVARCCVTTRHVPSSILPPNHMWIGLSTPRRFHPKPISLARFGYWKQRGIGGRI